MILDRWFRLAARYVAAIESTAVSTEMIAAAQVRGNETTAKVLSKAAEASAANAAASSRIADAHALAAERGPSRLELPELGPLVEGIAEVARALKYLKQKLPFPPSPAHPGEGSPSEGNEP